MKTDREKEEEIYEYIRKGDLYSIKSMDATVIKHYEEDLIEYWKKFHTLFIDFCASHNQLDILKYFHKNGFKYSSDSLFDSIDNENLEMSKYLIENCPDLITKENMLFITHVYFETLHSLDTNNTCLKKIR